MKSILFIASNDNHLRIFEPVLNVLSKRNAINVNLLILSFASEATEIKELSARIDFIKLDNVLSESGIFPKKIAALGKLRKQLQDITASKDVIIIASDFPSYMRMVVRLANDNNIPILLFQDGNIESKFSKFDYDFEKSLRHKLCVLIRRALLLALELLRKEYFVVGRYGTSNVTSIFVWGEHYANALNRVGVGRDRLQVIGSPRHDKIFYELGNRFDKLIEGTFSQPRKFLIATSVPSSAYINYRHLVDEEIIQIIRVLRSETKDCEILIKIHPSFESIDYYDSLLKVNGLGSIAVFQKEDILSILKTVDVVFTSFSTVGFESLALSIPTIFTFLNYPVARYDFFRKEHDKRIIAVSSESELREAINTVLHDTKYVRRKLPETQEIARDYFENMGGTASQKAVERIFSFV